MKEITRLAARLHVWYREWDTGKGAVGIIKLSPEFDFDNIKWEWKEAHGGCELLGRAQFRHPV